MLKTNKAFGAGGLIRIEDNKYEDDSARNKADGDVQHLLKSLPII